MTEHFLSNRKISFLLFITLLHNKYQIIINIIIININTNIVCIIIYIYMQWKKNFIILYYKIRRIIIRSKMEPYKFSKWLTHAYTVPPQIHLIIAIDNQEIRLLDNQLESSCYATKRNNTFVRANCNCITDRRYTGKQSTHYLIDIVDMTNISSRFNGGRKHFEIYCFFLVFYSLWLN